MKKLDILKNGLMNGSNIEVMKSLYNSLPEGERISEKDSENIMCYISELWLRNISKQEFFDYVSSCER